MKTRQLITTVRSGEDLAEQLVALLSQLAEIKGAIAIGHPLRRDLNATKHLILRVQTEQARRRRVERADNLAKQTSIVEASHRSKMERIRATAEEQRGRDREVSHAFVTAAREVLSREQYLAIWDLVHSRRQGPEEAPS